MLPRRFIAPNATELLPCPLGAAQCSVVPCGAVPADRNMLRLLLSMRCRPASDISRAAATAAAAVIVVDVLRIGTASDGQKRASNQPRHDWLACERRA